jgi:hypothetical protein
MVTKFDGEPVSVAPSDLTFHHTASVTADGITKPYDIRLEWSHETQDFIITEIVPAE